VTFADIAAAAERVAGGVVRTPCPVSPALSEAVGCRVSCKLEFQQRTGNFKERGARNRLMMMSAEQRARGVIAASAGNHAQALSYHGRLLSAPVTVVMPKFAPLVKVASCRKLGARVVLAGDSFGEAQAHADEIARRDGLAYVNGFDDPDVIAGAGTVGLEVLEQVPDVDSVLIPVGGGGLVAGMSLAIKSQRPEVQVIAVEPMASASFGAARAVGRPVAVAARPTLADGLSVPKMGANAFAVANPLTDRIVPVAEDHIALAILRHAETDKCVVEGAAAAPLAALLSGQLPELAGKRVALVLCGGNIDMTTLHRVIERGLVADGRLTRFTAVISDRPGGLAALASCIAAAGASIKDISHDRAFAGPDVTAVRALCTVETRDRDHIRELHERLAAAGIPIVEGRLSGEE
jgi:threonine dehydratase